MAVTVISSPRKALLATEQQVRDALVPSPGWDWTGLPEGFGRWRYQPWVSSWFFSPFLMETQAVTVLLSTRLLPGTLERPGLLQPQTERFLPRRTRRVFRQEKLCSSIVPPHEGRGRSLPTTTASDIRESTPKHQGAAPAPQILLLGKRPDKPSPIPGEEDVSPRLPAPKPRPRSHREVASQGWKTPGSGTAGSKPCNSPGPPFPDPPALGHSFSSLLRSRCPVAALWLLVEPTCASSPATGILRGCGALSTPRSPFCQHEVSWVPG